MTVHTLEALMVMLSRVEQFSEEEQDAAAVLATAVHRVFPKGRAWTVLSEDQDPALVELESIGRDVSEISDSIALIEDRLTEIKRQRAVLSGSSQVPVLPETL